MMAKGGNNPLEAGLVMITTLLGSWALSLLLPPRSSSLPLPLLLIAELLPKFCLSCGRRRLKNPWDGWSGMIVAAKRANFHGGRRIVLWYLTTRLTTDVRCWCLPVALTG
ncbi:hypothetical protein B0T26DRAFT_86575 [Lasiosphaeria miniovina]|uniref:Uncharacterized protein n=1 Tax=Lasiosphaeria miniovina TaxID=1954250 RepID=A0AA40BIL7_9PEZI|nr:uncharacterized protein B0T26DRAFT_86575 [Lasiosphaeria miniovina]KAK0734907.1 hypothetical protein B0T26DRAFT_86575 [Lasiosphaeria miniovina]